MESKTSPADRYRIVLRPAAGRFMEKLRDPKLGMRLQETLDQLSTQPRPPLAKMLSKKDGVWRVRVGDYRVLYQIDEADRVVRVAAIGHRREIYRD